MCMFPARITPSSPLNWLNSLWAGSAAHQCFMRWRNEDLHNRGCCHVVTHRKWCLVDAVSWWVGDKNGAAHSNHPVSEFAGFLWFSSTGGCCCRKPALENRANVLLDMCQRARWRALSYPQLWKPVACAKWKRCSLSSRQQLQWGDSAVNRPGSGAPGPLTYTSRWIYILSHTACSKEVRVWGTCAPGPLSSVLFAVNIFHFIAPGAELCDQVVCLCTACVHVSWLGSPLPPHIMVEWGD